MVDPPTTLESGALMSCVVGNSRITLQLAPCTPSTLYRGFLIHSQPPLDAVVLGVCVCVCVCAHSVMSTWDPVDCSPPGSSVRGTLQAGTLEWGAVPSARGPSWPRGRAWVPCLSAWAGGFFTTTPPAKLTAVKCSLWKKILITSGPEQFKSMFFQSVYCLYKMENSCSDHLL